jgi:Mobilization protein NikA
LGAVIPHHAITPARKRAVLLARLGKGEASPPPLHPPLTANQSQPQDAGAADPTMLAETERALAAPPKVRSGSSAVRQRRNIEQCRTDDAEHAELEARAGAAGLSIGAYLRACGLGAAGPRARRRPPVERALLAQANAEINRVGSNLNQIARTLNIAALEEPGTELAQRVMDVDQPIMAALADLSATLAAIRGALGYDSQG